MTEARRRTLSHPKRNTVIPLSLGALLLCAAIAGAAQDASWEISMQAATKAYREDDLAEAERQLSAALEQAQAFGPQDPRLASTLNNLGVLYYAQGKYREAEPIHKRALAIREKVLGRENADVAQSLNNLASVYGALGRLAEAEALYARCLAIREQALGKNHPEVAKTLENYAEVLRIRGRRAEAAKMEARAKAIRTKEAN